LEFSWNGISYEEEAELAFLQISTRHLPEIFGLNVFTKESFQLLVRIHIIQEFLLENLWEEEILIGAYPVTHLKQKVL
jgi:hypothetical protein